MSFFDLLLTRKFFFSFLITLTVSVLCTLFPLLGKLGYEYSVVIAIVLSYVAVFLSAESVPGSAENNRSFTRKENEDNLSALFLLGIILLAFSLLIGLVSSYVKNDCSVKSGIQFYLLIPGVSVIFAIALGACCASFFGKRGFFVGAMILTLTICYSVIGLYYQPHLFTYNTVFGYFPGPIYDRIIPVTRSFVLYRVNTLLWAMLLVVITIMKNGISTRKLGLSHIVIFILLSSLISAGYIYSHELGFGYSRDYIKNVVLGASYETENFNIYYRPGTRTEREIELIATDHEWRYKEIAEFLNVDPDEKIISYIYPDSDIRGKFIGAYNTTIANPIHKEIHLVYSSFPHDLLKHELVHVMASEFGSDILKISPGIGLMEGLAVASDWENNGLSTHQWAKLLKGRSNAIDIETIMGLSFWLQPSATSYTLMGSFCRFLIEEYGIEKFKEFYRTGDTDVYGKNIGELSASWKDFLDTLPTVEHAKEFSDYRFSEKAITSEYCPRKKEELRINGVEAMNTGNYHDAVYYLSRAYKIAKSDPDIRTPLSYAYYYDKDYRNLLNIINSDNGGRGIQNNILRNLRANLLWQNNGYVLALSMFEQLRDKPLPENIKREIEIKISLENYDSELKSMYLEFLKTNNTIDRLVILQEIVSRYNFFAPAYHKLAEMFFNTGDYQRAATYSYKAEARGLPSRNLKLHNLRILGVSLYALEDYTGSVNAFDRYKMVSADNADVSYANDFIDRVKWTMSYRNKLNK